MWRALVLALLLIACAPTHADTSPITWPTPITGVPNMRASGDFDGDGRGDEAAFYETEDGALTLMVRRAAAPEAPHSLWGGDIASLPYYTVRAAPPGRYETACDLYGGCVDPVPTEVTLTHDGLFVLGSEPLTKSLYYWDGESFRDIMLSADAH